MRKVKCNKTLTFPGGSIDFIKGKEYPVMSEFITKLTTTTRVKNENGQSHLLGNWVKYFKLI